MKKQIIDFKENEYKQSIVQLDKAIREINEAITILIANGKTTIDMDFIWNLATDTRTFINSVYYGKLCEILNIYGVDIQKYDLSRDETTRNLASSAIQYLWEAAKKIKMCHLTNYLLNEKFIIIKDNVAEKAPNAEDNLKEQFTIYTLNDRQYKTTDILNNIIKELRELEKINVDPNAFFIVHGLYKVDNEWKIQAKSFQNIS
jgi:hypothetical protein